MKRFKPKSVLGVGLVTAGIVLSASLAVASKPLTGGVSATEVIRQLQPPKAIVQPLIRGFVGLDLSIVPNQPPLVKSVFPQSPAALGGLQAGDVLLSADNQSLIGLGRQATDDAISDVIGHIITFQVQRGSRVFAVKVKVAPASSGF